MKRKKKNNKGFSRFVNFLEGYHQWLEQENPLRKDEEEKRKCTKTKKGFDFEGVMVKVGGKNQSLRWNEEGKREGVVAVFSVRGK